MLTLGRTRFDIVQTPHGPEIEVIDNMGYCERLTVFEAEHFGVKYKHMVETARAQATARVRQLPMRRT